MTKFDMSEDDKKHLQSMGVEIIDLPKVYDDISLFDFANKLLTAFATTLGEEKPTYKQVKDASNKVKDFLDSSTTND